MEKLKVLQKKLSKANTGHSTIESFDVIKDICLITKPLNILEIGFENTANKFSESSSSRNGGDIGWIKDSQLSETIRKKMINLGVGKYSEVINLPGGNLILKINDIKEEKIDLNFEDEFKKLIIYEKNRQLNQFSIIYFNRIKQNANFSEK